MRRRGNAPFLLSGEPYSREAAEKKEQKDFDFPLDCVVDFDMRLIDLFKEMANRKKTRRSVFKGSIFVLRNYLEERFLRVWIFLLIWMRKYINYV